MAAARPPIPRTVWALGLVSLFMDLSFETIHALLPLFLTVTLGASVALVGLIDGMAEATASIAKVFSGYLSDRLRKRKALILIGYGLGAVTKPLFALAGSPAVVFGARFADRIGKGLRGAPRDALVADVTPPEIRGRAFGLRQSLDTVGAFAGPLLAIGLMVLFANDIRMVFWIAAIPAALAVACVVFGVEDAPVATAPVATPPVRLIDLKRLPRAFADHSPADLRGSAFGAFNLMTGVAMLFASVIAGLVWDRFGTNATFLVGVFFAAVALLIAAQLKAVAEIF